MNNAVSEQQTWLQAAISRPQDTELAAQAAYFLKSSEKLSSAHRLAIYQGSYRARLLQSFHAIFPALLQALGSETLNAFALDFLQHKPPSHFSINRIADGFVEYLQHTRPASLTSPNWSDFVINLAQAEMSLLEVSEARGLETRKATTTESITSHTIQSLSEAEFLACQPRQTPCLCLLHCSYPVHEYLQAIRQQSTTPDMPEPHETWLAITRVNFHLSTRELAQVQWQLLALFDGKKTLTDILHTLAAHHFKPTPTIDLLRLWIGNFMFQGLLESIF